MRILLVGKPADRARLLAEINDAGIEVVGEFDTVADARAAMVGADAVMLAAREGTAFRYATTTPNGSKNHSRRAKSRCLSCWPKGFPTSQLPSASASAIRQLNFMWHRSWRSSAPPTARTPCALPCVRGLISL